MGGEEDERADCSVFKPIKTEAQTLALTLTSCITLFFFFKDLFILRLHWLLVAAHGFSQYAASRGSSSLWCTGFSLQGFL